MGTLKRVVFTLLTAALMAGYAAAQEWTLVWSDEFNGPAGPFTPHSDNNLYWTFDTGAGSTFGTGEQETMISDGSTSYLDGNGSLVIEAYSVPGTPSRYYSGRIKTKLNGGFGQEFQYGRIEARIQIPYGQGIWPAFWMQGDNGIGWPGNGEIDIMENIGREPSTVHGTIHGIGYASTGLGFPYQSPDGTPFSADYHVYGMVWSPFLIQYYVDDPSNVYATFTPSDIMSPGRNGSTSTTGQWDFYNHSFYIIFDLAVGGPSAWGGAPDDTTIFPQYMNIDWVRVYQWAPWTNPTRLCASPISNSQVHLNWSNNTGDPSVTYNIFRSDTSGAEHSLGNLIAANVSANSFTDVLLTPGATYYYQVSATGEESEELGLSNEAAITLPLTGTNICPIAISAGGLVGSGNFVADTGYSGGATNAVPNAIDVTDISDPAPQSVYRTERWGAFTYTIPNLTPSASYRLRLHFIESAFPGVGQRHFNVAVNGTPILTNFDIYSTAGATFKAVVEDFIVSADDSGQLAIAFSPGSGAPHTNATLRGLEVIPLCSPQRIRRETR
ncbi:MAG: family 16 glycosylhydrolase [Acidobacteriaceae bacterium]|nr:family 16 glycosylhydrolase [Acidobacteriaceae bacterium]